MTLDRFIRFLDWLDDSGLSIVPAIIVLVGTPAFLAAVAFHLMTGGRP